MSTPGDRRVAEATAALVAAEQDATPPPGLVASVMRTVWADVRTATMLPLAGPGAAGPDGTALVADHVVTAVVEQAVDALPGLQVHTCVLRHDADDAPDRLALEVTAAAAFGIDVREATARARDRVREVVRRQFGWTATPIDIRIVDVYVPTEETP